MASTTLLNRASLQRIIPILLLLFAFAGTSAAEELPCNIQRRTLLYAVKGQDSLYMDIYTNIVPPKRDAASADGPQTAPRASRVAMAPRPALIFLSGGDSTAGGRDDERYWEYLCHIAEVGITVFSIDYRLEESAKLAPLAQSALDRAVEDLFTATLYILKHHFALSVDPLQIMASGSSAGAIIALQAEYYLANRKAPEQMPESFNYCGVIAFAGAIMSFGEDLQWEGMPAPIALFHGKADNIVPFKRIQSTSGGRKVSLNGSFTIAKSLKRRGAPYMLKSYKSKDHSVAVWAMQHQLEQVDYFLQKYIFRDK